MAAMQKQREKKVRSSYRITKREAFLVDYTIHRTGSVEIEADDEEDATKQTNLITLILIN